MMTQAMLETTFIQEKDLKEAYFLYPTNIDEIIYKYKDVEIPGNTNIEKKSTNLNVNIKRMPEGFIFLYPNKRPNQDHFISLQKWEGIVIEIKKESFVANLTDLFTNESNEEAEIYLNEIPEEDKILIEKGAYFYWNVGYLKSKGGQISRASVIRFRRLPAWHQKELNEAQMRATDIKKKLNW